MEGHPMRNVNSLSPTPPPVKEKENGNLSKSMAKAIERNTEKTGWGNIELQKLMLDCLVNPDKTTEITPTE